MNDSGPKENQIGPSPRSPEDNAPFVFPPFRLDPANEQLWRGDELLTLQPKPFAILRYLLERPRQLVSKEELLGYLWKDTHVTEAVLKTHLSEIRRALNDSAKTPRFIETAHSRGYRFIGTVQRAAVTRSPALQYSAVAPALPAQTSASACVPELGSAPFVAREAELEHLSQALEQALKRRRQVVFIAGEAGIGKTLLVKTFVEQLSGRADVLVAWGQCVEQYGAGEPYLPVLEALRRLCRGGDGERVSHILRRHAPSWLAQMPDALEPVPVEHAVPSVPERMLRELAEALEALTEQRSLVLWLEDLQWADPSTLDLISYVAQRSDPARVLMLLTCRTLDALASQRLANVKQHLVLRDRCDEVALPYLSKGAVAQYLAMRFGQHTFPTAMASMLHHRTNGNPLFMVMVVDSWLERGKIAQRRESWELLSPLEELSHGVPGTLALMIEREVERLSPFERTVLEGASAAGSEFFTTAVASAVAEDGARVDELCMRWGRRGQFLRLIGRAEWPDGTPTMRCEFVHALYQQVVYGLIGAARQAHLHQRLGERQEAAYGASAPQIAAELAMHFERGQDRRRAIHYLRAAANQAFQRNAYREAMDHLRRALDLLGKLPKDPEALQLELELCLALGSPLAVLQGYSAPETERVYHRARELCQAAGETPRLVPALAGIAAFFLTRGEYDTARELCEQVLVLEQRSDGVEAVLTSNLGLGLAHLFVGELPRAQRYFEELILKYRPGRDRVHRFLYQQDPGVVARCYLSYTITLLGYPDLGLQRAEESLSCAKETGDPFAIGFGLRALIFVHTFRGEHALAREHAKQLLDVCTEHGFKFLHALAMMVMGEAALGRADLDTGIRLLAEGLDAFAAIGAGIGLTYWTSRLAEAHRRAGHVNEALEVLGRCFSYVQSHNEHWWEAELYRIKGELLAGPEEAGGPASAANPACRSEAAEGNFLRALDVARQRKLKALELRAGLSLAKLWRAQGKDQQGRGVLAEIYASFTEGFDTADLQEAHSLMKAP